MTEGIELGRVTEEDMATGRALLDRAGLPVADLGRDAVMLYEARRDGERVGVGGLEIHGPVGLLRSLVVAPAHRHRGIGRTICAGLETEAMERGARDLYLLTTDAAGFFRACGYEAVSRSEVPAEIGETPEFADLCPADASCLWKPLPDSTPEA